MAPALITRIRTVVSSTPSVRRSAEAITGTLRDAHQLAARTDDSKSQRPSTDPSEGVLDPHDINNVGFFVLFALIGVAIVCAGIWFFFWAKNGGFQFKEDDWDDYKSTVLRRKGPNGTILSGATKTTALGGGSVYKDYDDEGTVVTESTALSGVTAGASDIVAREKRRQKQEKRDRERAAKRKSKGRDKEKKSKRYFGHDGGVEDEEAEQSAKKELRSYRHEKPARVGGLNKEAEGSEWDGSTSHGTESNVSTNLLSDQQTTPTNTPKKKTGGGIRKVYSTADRREERESERMRAEARRLREAGRASRRDFSFQQNESSLSESLLEGSSSPSHRGSDRSSDVGTKSYHHPRPELREMERQRAREERRARRNGGYRRGQTEDIDEGV